MSSVSAVSLNRRPQLIDDPRPGDDDPEVVGAKAANLMRMAGAGLAVPPGFVLGTNLCADVPVGVGPGQLGDEVTAGIARGVDHVERVLGRRLGASRRPLLLAVRSSPTASMPGMLDTVLDVGLCDTTVAGLLRHSGDPRFVWDSYRRLVQSYVQTVDGCPPAAVRAILDEALRRQDVPSVAELDVAALKDVVGELQEVARAETGRRFPQDPMDQLRGAVGAVVSSWHAERAVAYRRLEHLDDAAGTAVIVQAMVFGNLGGSSGSGVAFTRDPASGDNRLYVDFVLNVQGEDLVGGGHTVDDPDRPIASIPGLAHNLQSTRRALEGIFRDVQDVEFTVEDGKLWLLQTRDAKRTPWAALRIACDLVDEGIIDETTASDRLRGYDLEAISRIRLAAPGARPDARGTPAGTGVASGVVALDIDTARARAESGDAVILVRNIASPDDIAALALCRGLLTATGARTSHAAVVARQLGVVTVVGCVGLRIDPATRQVHLGRCDIHEGDVVTIDGTDGTVYAGAMAVVEERPSELVDRVRRWRRATAP